MTTHDPALVRPRSSRTCTPRGWVCWTSAMTRFASNRPNPRRDACFNSASRIEYRSTGPSKASVTALAIDLDPLSMLCRLVATVPPQRGTGVGRAAARRPRGPCYPHSSGMPINSRDLMAPDTEPTDEELALVMREARDLAVQRGSTADAWVAARLEEASIFARANAQPRRTDKSR